MTNWLAINANRKRRWERATPQGKTRILEEKELAKKIKILQSFIDTVEGPRIRLFEGEHKNISMLRVIEWGLQAKWGIRIKLLKYPGVRFEKLDGCPPILAYAPDHVKDDRLAKIKQAAKLLRDANVDDAANYATSFIKDVVKTPTDGTGT